MREEQDLRALYNAVRAFTEALCAPLETEDYVVQSMPDASPTKWHLAHTSWFFEKFVLVQTGGYEPFDPRFGFLFNSYFVSLGDRHSRPRRGLLTRPTVEETYRYRRYVDGRMRELLSEIEAGRHSDELAFAVRVGLNHEQQHQELLLTDLKHALAQNPLRPALRDPESVLWHDRKFPDDIGPARMNRDAGPSGHVGQEAASAGSSGHAGREAASAGGDAASAGPSGPQEPPGEARFVTYDEGVRWMGHGGPGFAFDNETPSHRVFVNSFAMATRPVTCGEYLAFMEDGGYSRPELWLSSGWDAIVTNGWTAPLYWERYSGAWRLFTLRGMRNIDPAEPVCHVSYFEADAFARWAGARLPTEAEWECAAARTLEASESNSSPSASRVVVGTFVESGRLHPAPIGRSDGTIPERLLGDVWEWTASSYVAYPGFSPWRGSLGEYNGKFMSGQMVLRGGSCFTPRAHIRPTYRNFFVPETRWQMSGIRLARSC